MAYPYSGAAASITRYRSRPGSHDATCRRTGARAIYGARRNATRVDLMRVVVELPSSPQAPGRARAALAGTRTALDEDLHADLVLVVSELVTNSVKYGPGRPIRVDVETDGPRRVRGEVVDQGDGAELVAAAAPGDDQPGGRGLRIVEQLGRWGVHDGSTHVWFELGDG